MKIIISIILILLSINNGYSQKDSIDIFISSKMRELRIPGLQLAIVKNGQIIKTESYGIANIEDSIKVNSNTTFVLNSITKAFTGVAVMQLVEQKKLSLDEPVSHYIDSLPTDWQRVTIKQLLTHTSGIPDMMDSTGKIIATWENVQKLPMDFNTNENFKYNQTNYVLIGRIIDKLSGMTFTKFIQEGQLKKIGAMRTLEAGFGHYQSVIPHSARGYTYYIDGSLTHVYEEFPLPFRTAAGMSATANELANWVIALQNGVLLKDTSSLSRLWKPAILNSGRTKGFNNLINGYAIGWPVVSRTDHPAAAAVGGGRSALFVYPNDAMAIIVLTNLEGASPEKFIDDIAGFYIPEMKKSKGFGLSPSLKLVRQSLESKGYGFAIRTYNNLKKKNKDFVLEEREVNKWGFQLLTENKKTEALEIFKLNVYLFPESANTYDSLAETYAILGNKSLAIINYSFALKYNPKNTNAVEQIRKLKSASD